MKKELNILLIVMLLSSMASCISNTDVVDGKSYPLAVSVSDYGFTSASGTKATTRATESGYVTTFAKGDQIGLYIVNNSNAVETANLCLTYDGTNWDYPTETTLYYDNTTNKRYFTYYPYQSTLTGAPTTSTATDAATFFATAISDWTPATDQSSQAKYTASDLMVGTGTIGALASNATRPMTFSMAHQMALVDMNFPYYYLSTDNNYTYTLGLTCSGFKPYHVSKGNYRYIIKPATNTSIWGYYCTTTSANTNQIFNKAVKAATGTYQTMNVDNTSTSTSYTMNIGDYYLNDGSVIPNATTNKYLLSKAIGVVFNTSTSTTDQGHGWTHGYAMALTKALSAVSWSTDTITTVLGSNNLINTIAELKADLDGYTHSQMVKNTAGNDISSKYPAFYYALNYSTDQIQYKSHEGIDSNWYLPSIGQWYEICINLGKMSSTPTATTSDWIRWYNGDDKSSNNYAQIAATNINSYFISLINNGYNVDKILNNTTYELIWSSSEYSNSRAYGADFATAGDLGLASNLYKKNNLNSLRPVLAF